jgi:hypothetical protein
VLLGTEDGFLICFIILSVSRALPLDSRMVKVKVKLSL